jgi:hypothetical protein
MGLYEVWLAIDREAHEGNVLRVPGGQPFETGTLFGFEGHRTARAHRTRGPAWMGRLRRRL